MKKRIHMNRALLLLSLLWVAGMRTHAQEIITLKRAMEIALINSPDLRQAELSLERSQRNLDAQRAGLKSLFSFTANPVEYSKSTQFDSFNAKWFNGERFKSGSTFQIEQPILATGGTLFLTDNFYWQYNNTEKYDKDLEQYVPEVSREFYNGLRIGFEQPIFQFNQLKYDLMDIELNYENTLLNYLLQRLALERNVSMAFYEVYEAQMSLDIAKSELQNNEESYRIISNKVEGGLAALEELYQAEVNLASSKSSVSNGQVSLENLKDAFKIAVGMDLDEDFMAMASVEITPVFVDQKQSVSYALGNRMEIRQREISIQQNQFALIETKSTINDFQGSISGSYGFSGVNPQFGNIYNTPTNEPNFAITLNIPIFDWGRRRNLIKAAEATIQSSEIDLENEKRDIIINVRQVYRSLGNLKNQIEIARLNVKNAQLTFDINQERYKNGDITGMDLNLYQTQLSNSKMSLTQALIDYKIELLNLKIQTLYDYENNVSIVPQELVSPTIDIN